MSEPTYSSHLRVPTYIRAIERYPVLDRDHEVALAQQAAADDADARDLLVCCNLRYVVPIAVALRGYGFAIGELVAEGNVGLVQAVERFDPDRGVRLMTYARHFIRARMLAIVMRQWSIVRMGEGTVTKRLFFTMPRERARLRARLGRSPEVDVRLAQRFGASVEGVRYVERRMRLRDRSLSQPVGRGGTPLVELLPAANADAEAIMLEHEARAHLWRALLDAFARLDRRERVIARRLFDKDQPTLTDLGRQLGVSLERVRQLEARVRGKLRASLSAFAA